MRTFFTVGLTGLLALGMTGMAMAVSFREDGLRSKVYMADR